MTERPNRRHGCPESDVVMKLESPAPFTTVVGIPPTFQLAGLAAGQNHERAEVFLRWPAIVSTNRHPRALKASHGEVRSFTAQRTRCRKDSGFTVANHHRQEFGR